MKKIITIDNNLLTAPFVKILDKKQREELIEPIFQYFRKLGWLYPDNLDKIPTEYNRLLHYSPNLQSNEVNNNDSIATGICKFFCHSFYNSTERNKKTMIELFNDDETLRKIIWNRLGLAWYDNPNNDETFNISFRMLIQGMRSMRLVPMIGVFKPSIAKYINMKYSSVGDTVFDYSAGFGGRMLGAASCGRKYIGVDPLTATELKNMRDYLRLENCTIIGGISEEYKGEENSVDLAWSSPPFFDQEYYSAHHTQAYNKGTDYFYNVYWENTLENVKFMLKPGKIFGLHVKNYPRMLQMAEEKFGKCIEQVALKTAHSHLYQGSDLFKYEFVYMFKNNK